MQYVDFSPGESYQRRHYRLWALLRLADFLTSAMRERSPWFSLAREHMGILFVVNALGKRATPAAISRVTFRKPHTVSKVLSNMEKKGLVRKYRDLPRANQVRVALTPKGRRVFRRVARHNPLVRSRVAASDTGMAQLETGLVWLIRTFVSRIPVSEEFMEVFEAVCKRASST
ncbi:MAG: MarR family winged helix-turn-helix transcriptional regulator [Chloroflexota bacterium]